MRDASSIVLANLCTRALAGVDDPTSTLGIFEWSAPDGCPVDDPDGWAQANPALGLRMPEQAIRSALETDPEDVFRTEVLCQWVTAVDTALPMAVWKALADPDSAQPTHSDTVRFALDVAPDHSTATISVAWRRSDGVTAVDLADHQPSCDWFVPRAVELGQRWRGRLLVEATGTAAFLVPELEKARVNVDSVSRRFYADACSALDAVVTSRQLRHRSRPELNKAVATACWSSSGDAGQRVLSRKDPRASHHSLPAHSPYTGGLSQAPKRTGRFAAF